MKFNSDVPSVPRDPPYQEAIQFPSSMLFEHLLCVGTVTDLDPTALKKGDKKPLLFNGFYSPRRKNT